MLVGGIEAVGEEADEVGEAVGEAAVEEEDGVEVPLLVQAVPDPGRRGWGSDFAKGGEIPRIVCCGVPAN